MEYIASELERNGVNLNKEVFKDQMNKIKEENEKRYEELMERVDGEDLKKIFHTTNMNSDARIVSFLLLLYYERQRDVDIRGPLRLVAIVMKLNFEKSKKPLWQGLVHYLGFIFICVLTHDFVKTF